MPGRPENRNPAARRAVATSLVAGAFFSGLAGPLKLAHAVYHHAPWLNDPYDAVVSFAMFYVPALVVFTLVRVAGSAGPPAAGRLVDQLRGCHLILAVASFTVASEWVSVALKANGPAYNWETWLQVSFLALLTVLTGSAIVCQIKVPVRRLAAEARKSGPRADWFSDAVAMVAVHSRWLGPARGPAVSIARWADRTIITRMRRWPLCTAAVIALAFGLAVGGIQALREGYLALAALLVISLLSIGMFAFLAAAGAYLRLLTGSAMLSVQRRRVRNAAVITSFGMLVVLALRNSLWWIIGSDAMKAGFAQAYMLFGLTAAIIFSGSLAVQQLRSTATGTARSPSR